MAANVISFREAARSKPQGLPKRMLALDYELRLKAAGIEAPSTLYDQWATALSGIDLAGKYFNGEVCGCALIQEATEHDKQLLGELRAVCREKMAQSYLAGRLEVARYLQAQGAPLDETTFETTLCY